MLNNDDDERDANLTKFAGNSHTVLN